MSETPDGRPVRRLLGDEALGRSSVVANSTMNRGRGLAGGNGYAKDLGFDVLAFLRERARERASVAWLDLCCGSGRALVEAGEALRAGEGAVEILGVDLVSMFVAIPADLSNVAFREADLSAWAPDRRYDLITCVHGLHYVGDKMGLLGRALGWLAPDGKLAASFDASSVRYAESGEPATRRVTAALRAAGCRYDARRKLVTARGGGRTLVWDPAYVGADDRAGPNYTGQPAVHSYYTRDGESSNNLE